MFDCNLLLKWKAAILVNLMGCGNSRIEELKPTEGVQADVSLQSEFSIDDATTMTAVLPALPPRSQDKDSRDVCGSKSPPSRHQQITSVSVCNLSASSVRCAADGPPNMALFPLSTPEETASPLTQKQTLHHSGASTSRSSDGSPLKGPSNQLKERLKKNCGTGFQSIIVPDSHSRDDTASGGNTTPFAMDAIPPLRAPPGGVLVAAAGGGGFHTCSELSPLRRESTSFPGFDVSSIHRNSTSSGMQPSSPLREGRVRTIQFVGETDHLETSEGGPDITEAPRGILVAETSFCDEIPSAQASSSIGSRGSFEPQPTLHA